MKIYENVYSDLVIPAGKTSFGFALNAPHFGLVKRLVVVQTGGAPTNFTVNLYSRHAVETAAGPATFTGSKHLVRIIPTQNGVAGAAVYFATDNDGYAYFNNEEGPATGIRRVYLEISPVASSGTTWQASITLSGLA